MEEAGRQTNQGPMMIFMVKPNKIVYLAERLRAVRNLNVELRKCCINKDVFETTPRQTGEFADRH